MLKNILLLVGTAIFSLTTFAQQTPNQTFQNGQNPISNGVTPYPSGHIAQKAILNPVNSIQSNAIQNNQVGPVSAGQHVCKAHELNEQYWASQGLLNDYNQSYLNAAQSIGTWNSNHTPNPNEISVIFHVVYNPNNPAENVSNALIMQVFQDLTEDFQLLNLDASQARAAYGFVPADADINFCLATQDPLGNPLAEIGVNRVATTEDWYDSDNGEENKMKYTSQGGTDSWGRDNYLNVWICDISNGAGSGTAGYAYRPVPPSFLPNPAWDGIVLDYNLGMNNDNVLTHEVGHYLGLDHTWGGSGGCGSDDGFGDTPVTDGPSFNYGGSCSGFQETCPGTQTQYENYMDYANCTVMFTQEQADYMMMVLTTMRSSLMLSPGCDPTNTPPNSAFTSQPASPVIIPQNGQVNFIDLSTNVPTGWSWTISGTQGVDWAYVNGTSNTSQNPEVEFYNIGLYDVSLTASNVYGVDPTPASEIGYVEVVAPAVGTACDTLRNWDPADAALNGYYYYNSGGNFGYFPGHNEAGGSNFYTYQYAEQFSAPATAYVRRFRMPVFIAEDVSGTGFIILKTYDNDNGGLPGTVLDEDTVLIADLNAGFWNELDFSSTQQVTGTFFAGFELFYGAPQDTILIGMTDTQTGGNDSYFVDVNNIGWDDASTLLGITGSIALDVLLSNGPAPVLSLTLSDTTVCLGGDITANASGSQNTTNYYWYQTDDPVTTILDDNFTAGTTFNFPGPAGNYRIYAFVDGSCMTDGGFVPIVVNDLVTATVTPTATTCGNNNGTIVVSGETGGTGTYYYSLDGVNYQTGNTFTGLAPGDYDVYIATEGDNCETMYTVTVASSTPVSATVSANQSICPGGSATITAGGGINYQWTDGVSVIGTTPSIVVTPANTTQFGCLVTDGFGCQGMVYTTVTVNPTPIATATNTGAYCPGDVMAVNETGGEATSWSWTSDGSATFSNSNAQNPTITGVVNGETFTVNIIDANGCTNTSQTIVTIYPQPNATATNSGAACVGDALTVNETAGDATSWSWTSDGSATFSNSNVQNPTVNGAVNGETFTVTVTDGNGCTNTANTIVTVNALPNPIASNSGAYCPGDAMDVTETSGSAVSWSWSSNGSAVFSNPNVQNPTITGAVNGEIFTVSITDGNGCSNTAQTIVTINPAPNATASNTGPVCDGATLSVNETAGDATSWSWSTSGSATFSNSNSQNPTVTGAVDGETFTVTVTDGNGCTNTANTIVTIIPAPAINPGTVTDPSACATLTGSIEITGPAGSGDITWTGTASGSATSTLPYTIGSLGAGSYTITFTDGNGCVSNVLNVGLNDPSSPTFNLGATVDPSTCGGTQGTITLTGLNPSTTYNLTYDDNGVGVGPNSITTDATGNYIITGLDAGTYDNFVANLAGCTGSQAGPIILTDPALPNATASNSGAYCVGDAMDVNETAGDATSWSWTSNGSASFSDPNAQNPTVTGAINGEVFTVTVTDGNGCQNTAQTIITVNPLPIVSATNSGPYCAGDVMDVSEIAGQGTSWSWSSNGSAVFSSTTAQNPTITGAVDGEIFTVTVTNGNGCVNTAQTTITINPTPNANATNSGAYCDGDAMDVSEIAGDATSWSWTTNGSASFSSTTAQNPTITGAVDGETFTVTVTDGNGCTNTAQTTITINALPTVSAGADQIECEGTTIVLSGSGASTYTWDNGVTDGVGFTPAPGTITYTVTGTDGNGCTNTDEVDVTINALPTVNAGVDQIVCDGSQVTLTGSGASTYTWDNGVTDGVAFTPAIGTITYTVTGTDANGCVNTDQVDVTVNALPTVNAGADLTACDGDQVTLSGSGASTYSWDNGITDGVAFTPPLGTTTYTVTGTDANGCSNTDQVDVVINALPTVTVTADDTTCANYTSVTLVGTPAGGTYSGTGVSGSLFDPSAAGVGTHTISYSYTDGNGCTNTSTQDIFVDICTGIDEGVFDDLQVYPNPTFNEFAIALEGEFTFSLIDSRGRLVLEGKGQNEENVNMTRYEAGVYFLTIDSNEESTVVRLIKE